MFIPFIFELKKIMQILSKISREKKKQLKKFFFFLRDFIKNKKIIKLN
jgi:hypothetical protein